MTNERHELAQGFLASTDWHGAEQTPLAGDASNRKYDRVHKDGLPPAVLMDAPPEKGEDVRPFTAIARHLTDLGLSAPMIYAEDVAHGFLLIEDLGDDLFARVLERQPALEAQLYQAAIDALIVAQNAPPPALAPYDLEAMATTAMLLTDWYLPNATGAAKPDALRKNYDTLVRDMLARLMTGQPVLVQRDYHAENLLWLPKRDGAARVGLLDFQDAMLGHPAYDLASLLKDARRDVAADVQRDMLAYYVGQTGVDADDFAAAYAACSAQRNLRIMGVFARLCVRDGKSGYPDLMPRVWRNLVDDLSHPALAELQAFIAAHIPPPDAKIVARIKAARHG
ncbi:aminoglycoside phosphotransferase family protein [Litoreibacter arenae]|uniref:Putative phosphotransferase n=1 Tax=Litoreibacter arenae DSM 19593 TaxID=1123360 RepID=S9QCR7_9RHOB|nr:phosphotransferase [Litoreibacter arenae]EPX77403.1 putative phosphotransferase [Litoreibacter arenae DSM 19593]